LGGRRLAHRGQAAEEGSGTSIVSEGKSERFMAARAARAACAAARAGRAAAGGRGRGAGTVPGTVTAARGDGCEERRTEGARMVRAPAAGPRARARRRSLDRRAARAA